LQKGRGFFNPASKGLVGTAARRAGVTQFRRWAKQQGLQFLFGNFLRSSPNKATISNQIFPTTSRFLNFYCLPTPQVFFLRRGGNDDRATVFGSTTQLWSSIG
jgi:hypothetical protein